MEHVTLKAVGAVAEVTLGRGKVDALDERLVERIRAQRASALGTDLAALSLRVP